MQKSNSVEEYEEPPCTHPQASGILNSQPAFVRLYFHPLPREYFLV